MKSQLSIGIVGAGSFAAFAAQAFLQLQGIKIVAVCDANVEHGKKFATEFSAVFYPTYSDFVKDNIMDLVYIATPPFLHFRMSMEALYAGKHVICEKPAALTTLEAEEAHALAKKQNLLYVVNLMQRYNPLYSVVKNIIDQNLLGNFLHGFFENYASDENLPADHWFWDHDKSGGIFIEHAVHFFDMFDGWFAKGKIISAFQLRRPHAIKTIFDRVQATVLYEGGPVNFYHGFDQPMALDRQEMRLQFEKGDISLYEWIPVKMRLRGLFNTADLQKVTELIGPCSVVESGFETQEKRVKGRFSEILFDKDVTIESGSSNEKTPRYQLMLTAMLRDQWNWILDNAHSRIIDGNNGVASLRMAEDATRMAQQF